MAQFKRLQHLLITITALYISQTLANPIANETELEYVFLSNPALPCKRVCVENGPPMVCRYHFSIEWYYSMSKACYDCPHNLTDCDRPHCITADGVKRPVVAINRQIPGTSIEVCKGDRVIVDVQNSLLGDTTTIHWHGFHQRDTPYMDGVPFVTQCPIQPGSTFTYDFKAMNEGTHFWHSHTGFQRSDGAFGPFIVRVPDAQDPHRELYDYDMSQHVMVILDWGHEVGLQKFVAHHHSDGNNKSPNLLVNGKGRFKTFENISDTEVYTPTARFTVSQGYRYRFRIINAEFLNCPIEVSVDNHTLIVISSDGNDVEPVEAESIVTYAGERFDFILNADQEVDNYWIRFRGLLDCDARFTSAHQAAVLHYEGAADEEPTLELTYEMSHKDGMQVNALNVGYGGENTLIMAELNATAEDDISLKTEPDFQYYIAYDFYAKDNPHYHNSDLYGFYQVPDKKQRLYTPQLNHVSLKLQPYPLLSGREFINEDTFCNETTLADKNCTESYCECTHVIQVPLGAVVELVLVDKGFTFDANHPFHLHGHAFRVVAMNRLGQNTTVEEVQELDRNGLINRKLTGAPLKDTVTVPDGGYTILRFHASNPGYWLFHCHIEFHVELGMALVFKVGEYSQFKPVPRNFPQCNNWAPSLEEDNHTTAKSPEISTTESNNGNSSPNLKTTDVLKLFNILFLLLRNSS